MRSPFALVFGLALAQLGLIASAAALPLSASQGKTCVPSFSGLTQTIRHSGQRSSGWQAVLAKASTSRKKKPSGSLIGVKAGAYHKKASDDLSMEWLIAHDRSQAPSTFTLTSAAAMLGCLGADPSGFKLQKPLSNAKGSRACLARSSYEFEVRCLACDRFDDAASGCQIRSTLNGHCAQADPDTGKLSWDTCAKSTIARYGRQLFDIGLFLSE